MTLLKVLYLGSLLCSFVMFRLLLSELEGYGLFAIGKSHIQSLLCCDQLCKLTYHLLSKRK